MIDYTAISGRPAERSRKLWQMIHSGAVTMAGHKHLKIYGTLRCRSGKRMLPGNRVLFRDSREAEALGYRPCGHCSREAYQKWKTKHEYFISARRTAEHLAF